MKNAATRLDANALREAMAQFWSENLTVKETNGVLIAALPLLFPDGLQVIVDIKQISERSAIISDRGEVLSNLFGSGMDLGKQTTTREIIESQLKAFELGRRGLEIEKSIKLPIDGLDIHLFGEALVSIAHLIYRHETDSPKTQHVYTFVRKLLSDRSVPFKEKEQAVVHGKVEGEIRVDFLSNGKSKTKIAFKAIERKGRMRDYIEQWGFRWRDAKDSNPSLVSSMFYDPDNQAWDNDSLRIGQNVCEIFEPYYETTRIFNALDKYL